MKRSLLIVLALVLSLGLALGGTMAYLQDTDSDVNVMTLGNVYISQHEYERVPDGNGGYKKITTESGESYELQPFTQEKPLYPYVGDLSKGDSTPVRFDQIENAGGTAWVAGNVANVQDKFVLVENTGKSDAYVRTLIAVEGNDKLTELIGLIYNTGWEMHDPKLEITVEGATYVVMEFVYTGSADRHAGGVLPAGEWTNSSLCQVIMDKTATNEDVEAIDTNKNGMYDILVLSQAVQTQGFADAQAALDTAFGPVTVENGDEVAEWFGQAKKDVEEEANRYTLVHNAEELTAALAEGGKIRFANDITATTETFTINAGTILDGDGYRLIHSGKSGTVIFNPKGGTIKNMEIVGSGGFNAVYAIGSMQYASTTLMGDLVLDGVTITGCRSATINLDANGCDVRAKNCEITNDVIIVKQGETVFDGCHFSTGEFPGDNKLTLIFLNGNMKFTECHLEESTDFYAEESNYPGTITFTKCTYGNNGVEDRPFEPTVGFFSWWMNPPQGSIYGYLGTFGDGKPASTNFTFIVDSTTVWEAQQ